MYRNLEEERKNKMVAADEGTEETCNCPCIKGAEKSQAEAPKGTQATDKLAVHYQING